MSQRRSAMQQQRVVMTHRYERRRSAEPDGGPHRLPRGWSAGDAGPAHTMRGAPTPAPWGAWGAEPLTAGVPGGRPPGKIQP